MLFIAKTNVFGYTNFYVAEAEKEEEVKPRVVKYIVNAVADETVSTDPDEWKVEVERLQFEPATGIAYIGTTGDD